MSGTIAGQTRRPGRPAKPRAERRTEKITVMVSPSERQALEGQAGAAGLETGVYLRAVGLRHRVAGVVPAINLTAWRELARAAANLNQIAAHLNGGGRFDARGTPRLTEALDALREEVTALRLGLLGAMGEGDEGE